ncbi:hypothetical protein [Allofrancisella frigidaquae]|uniref:Lipoprotein n=1 Tax=Allofrancisella frigidaquae TaxID=1085644 RepID=A0A6M3HT01_9GAMM|nr:hypothetical protein [Allofrancisella frigidaquae]KEI35953.1 hypothetical protein FRA_24c00380 [Francisella sp. W12-1067]QIV94313.1 hypothetical protein E3E15_02655 [Allofrancisella frigidaquae]
MFKHTFKITLLLLFIISLFSCATRQKYIDQQKAWIGKNIDQYMKVFGYPENVISVAPNPNIQTYVYIRTAVNPETPALAGSAVNSLVMANRDPQFVQFGALKCTTWVSIDKNTKIIKNITFRGNYCATRN